MFPTCRAETRSQGIATPGRAARHPRPPGGTLQSRDPFSGDCDAEEAGQTMTPAAKRGLQSRDPFSGDCDASRSCRASSRHVDSLQSRDPFSGDCDPDPGDHTRAVGKESLAEPRPVLRGLRRDPLSASFAPDFLHGFLQSRDPFSGDCDPITTTAETVEVVSACRAETRSQGIATRPPARRLLDPAAAPLQSRDPFSGDCDRRSAFRLLNFGWNSLQSRDPFSGDCDSHSSP